MPTAVESIESELQGRIAELREEEQRLSAALAILHNGHVRPARKPTPNPAPAAPMAAKPSGRSTRPGKTIHEDQIINAIHANGEPASLGQIREALGVAKDTALPRKLKAMVDSGLLKRRGERAGSRYTPA